MVQFITGDHLCPSEPDQLGCYFYWNYLVDVPEAKWKKEPACFPGGCGFLLGLIKVHVGFGQVSSWQDASWAVIWGCASRFVQVQSSPVTFCDLHHWTECGQLKVFLSVKRRCIGVQFCKCMSLWGRREGHAFTSTALHTCVHPDT